MYVKRSRAPQMVTLPDGSALTVADLPPRSTSRWVASRKARVVQAVTHGLLSAEAACDRYDLSQEELQLWVDGFSQHGERGLKTTAIQSLRNS